MGYYLAGGGFKIHWNGSSWTESPEPNGGAFAAIASDNIFSVGSEIWHWDGSTWMLDDPLTGVAYPSLVNAVTFSNGDIWACGVSTDADSHFHTLVYRTGNALSSKADAESVILNVRLFPNPASSSLNVNWDNAGTVNLAVIDATGKNLETKSFQGSKATSIDVSRYTSGIYFLRVEGKNFAAVRKFVISN